MVQEGIRMLSVGTLEPEDRPAWEELFTGYQAFYGRSFWPERNYERTWHRIQAADRIHARGARLDGRLVGIAHFLTHPSTTSADVCFLQDLFTAPDARGRGVARALIADIEGWARAQGCARLYWHTHETNETARRLYDRIAENRGFIQYVVQL
jgi:GNAT superfamily N-acetyltransferase